MTQVSQCATGLPNTGSVSLKIAARDHGLNAFRASMRGRSAEENKRAISLGVDIAKLWLSQRRASPPPFCVTSPRGYPAWDSIWGSSLFAAWVEFNAREEGSNALSIAGVLSKSFVDAQAPVRFLSAGIGEAFKRTKVSQQPDAPKIFLPIFGLALPSGLLVTEGGENARFVVVSIDDAGRFAKGVVFVGAKASALSKAGVTMDPHSSFALPLTSDGAHEGKALAALGIGLAGSGPIEAKPCSFADQVDRIVFSSIMVMAHRPDLISEEMPPRVSGRGFAARAESAAPRSAVWIGKSYQRRNAIRFANEASGEAQSPVGEHWRCGHWHTVKYGPAKKLSRVQWYEAIFVDGRTRRSGLKPDSVRSSV